MRNISTLTYCISSIRNDLKITEVRKVEEELKDSVSMMRFEPSEKTVRNILDFARSYEVIETESAGYVEMNLN